MDRIIQGGYKTPTVLTLKPCETSILKGRSENDKYWK